MSSERHAGKYIIGLVLGFLVGVALELLLGFGLSFALFTLTLAGALTVMRADRHVVFVCLGLFLGVIRVGLAEEALRSANVEILAMEQFSGMVRVINSPVVTERGLEWYADTEEGGTRVLVRSGFAPRVRYGDSVFISAQVRPVRNFDAKFDYVSFRKSQGVMAELRAEKVEVREEGSFSVYRVLYALRTRILESYRSVLPEPHASLLGGMTLGTIDGLKGDTEDSFRTAGFSHLIVVSGYNIALVASALAFFLKGRGLWWEIGAGAVGAILFTLMSGAGSSSARALIAVLVALFARGLGREYDVGRALVFVLFVMVLWNPFALLFDISLHLSLLATLGIVYGMPPVSWRFEAWPSVWGIREAFVTTLSAQLFVFPYIMFQFGTFAPYSLLANMLVLPVVPIVMISGAVIPVASFIFPVAYFFLAYILFVADLFAKLPGATLSFETNSFLGMILMYTLVFTVLFPEALWKQSKIIGEE